MIEADCACVLTHIPTAVDTAIMVTSIEARSDCGVWRPVVGGKQSRRARDFTRRLVSSWQLMALPVHNYTKRFPIYLVTENKTSLGQKVKSDAHVKGGKRQDI